jgi:RNA polymerase sigma factor (sigma-70 family)
VLYDRHHRGVLSYCRHMLGSREEAEDAVQQAFVSAHADIVSSDKPIRFKAWIYTIARNRCLSTLRARREQPSDDLERISTAGLSEEVQQRADLQELISDMQELPEEQRAALILSELGDLSHAEVAEVVGCEAAKVKSLVFQARSGLIERREARETPCEEIREQLSTLRGGSLRRGPLRRHLKACPGCAAFREDVKRQRQMVAAILPVIPTLGLRESALAAVGVGGATGGGALVGGGGAAIVAAKTGAAKIGVIAVATGGAVGGGVAVQQEVADSGGKSAQTRQAESAPAAVAPAGDDAAGADGVTGAGTTAPADDTTARGGEERSRGEDGARDPQAKDDPRRGFQPVQGGSNGDGARDFALGRGNGQKNGLKKDRLKKQKKDEATAGSNGKGRAKGKKPKRQKPANSNGKRPAKPEKPKPKPERPARPAPPVQQPPVVPPGLNPPTPQGLGIPNRGSAGTKSRRADKREKPSARPRPGS